MELLESVLREEGIAADIHAIHVVDVTAAKALRFSESPTIRINGVDVDPSPAAKTATDQPSLTCRWYPNGLTTGAAIRARLRAAQGR